MTKLYQLSVAIVFIGAAFARIFLIGRVPPATFIDEFNLSVPAARIALGSLSIPWNGFGWYATPGLFFYYLALIFKIVGISIISIKSAWLIPAIISLPLVYLFGKKLFKSRFVGMASLLLFGFNVVAVHIARWGHGSVIIATFQLITLLFFWLAEESQTWRSYLYASLSAFIAGLSLYFYVGSRSFLLFIPSFYLWYWAFSGHTNRKKKSLLILFSVMLLVVSLPMLIQITHDQFNFIWRLQEVSIFQTEVPLWTNLTNLSSNILKYLKILLNGVDQNLRHNPLNTTIFPFYLGLIIPIGLLTMVLKKTVRKQGGFLSIALLTTMAGGILSKEAPSYFRIFGSIPILCICIAATFYLLLQLLKNNRSFVKFSQVQVTVLLLLVGSLLFKLITYYQFMLQPSPALSEAFTYPEQIIAETIVKSKTQGMPVYISADYLYSSTYFFSLPKNALSEYQLFDVDSLTAVNQPVILILDSSGKGLQPFLEAYFDITHQYEIQTGQSELPVVYKLSPKNSTSASPGLTIVCDDGKSQLLERRSLGIFHSFNTFPENMLNCRWYGKLIIVQAGEYQFKGSADDSLSLQLSNSSGSQVINQQPTSNWQVSVRLDSGMYDFVAEYQNKGGARAARLEWQLPGEREFKLINPLAFIQAEKYE